MRTWLKSMRIEHNLSQEEMAEKLGITGPAYCYIEQGKRRKKMDLPTADKLSKIFCVPIKRIVELEQGEIE